MGQWNLRSSPIGLRSSYSLESSRWLTLLLLIIHNFQAYYFPPSSDS
jgi:hypothetical protein